VCHPVQFVRRAQELRSSIYSKVLLKSSQRIIGTVAVGDEDLDIGVIDVCNVAENILYPWSRAVQGDRDTD
jgi:hypothetical protein